jgi:MFS transporter, DHA2 family, integral membrane protein
LLLLGLSLQADSSYWYMLPIFMVMGHGMGCTMAPMTAAVMNAVGPQRAGLGSAMTNTSREVGGVLGIAVLGTILTTKLKDAFVPAIAGLGIPADQATAIGQAASHGDLSPAVLAGLTPEQQAGVANAFATSFMDGFHAALVLGGIVLLIAAIVANRFIPGRETIAEHHAAAEALAVAH